MEKEAEHKIPGNVNQGANVRKLRQIMGMKQETLAEMLQTTQRVISRIEQRKVIADDTLEKIANALNVSPKIIQELEENPFSLIIENNTFKDGSYMGNGVGNAGVIENDQVQNNHNNQQIHPLDKIVEMNKETTALYERMLTVEKEKTALLEQLLKEKNG